jgi:carbon-monoxide dehydrogenase medium subunit
MYATRYVRATSLDEAVSVLAANEEARPLSGGMTLVPTLKQRLAAPTHLIDLTRVDALHGIVSEPPMLRIGAATTHAQVAASPVVAAAIPALAKLAGLIADPQVRNRGTLGGSVANDDPAADYPSAVLALNAVVVTTLRRIPADEFFIDTFVTALEPAELITAIEFQAPRWANYAKLRHPASGYAVVGVFIARHASHVRVAVTGAGASVFRWRAAERALQEDFSIHALDAIAPAPSDFPDDAHASARYRSHLVATYARHALRAYTE